YLLLFDHLPVDEFLDVGVIKIEHDHLGGPARGTAGLDGARGPVTYLEKAHQATRFAAAGKRLAFSAQGREVRPRPGAVLEDSGLSDPQIHNAAFVDQIVSYGLDEAGVRRRVLVSRSRTSDLCGLGVDSVVTLRWPFDAIS